MGTDSQFDLVVFDWDGTLIDSVGTIVACTAAVMAELGLDPVPEETVRSMIGSGLSESIQAMAPDGDDDVLEQVIATYRRLWIEEFHSRSALFPESRAVLDQLRADGYLLAVATAKGRRGLGLDLERVGLRECFQTLRTADDGPAKPSPQILFEILEELGATAGRTIMVGDSVHDMRMGHNAGVTTVAVTSGAISRELLRVENPSACLDSVADLPRWIEAAG